VVCPFAHPLTLVRFLSFTVRLALVTALCTGMQGTLLVEALFLMRQGHIAEHHCENRHNPDVHCDGMCFLVKRISEVHGTHGDHTHASLTMRGPTVEIQAVTIPWAAAVLRPSEARAFPHSVARPATDPVPDDIYRPPWT